MGSPRPITPEIMYHQECSFTSPFLPDKRRGKKADGPATPRVGTQGLRSFRSFLYFLFILNGPNPAFPHTRNLKTAGLWPKNPGASLFFLQSLEIVSVGTLQFKAKSLYNSASGHTWAHQATFITQGMAKSQVAMVA